jgi:hypothetical protein
VNPAAKGFIRANVCTPNGSDIARVFEGSHLLFLSAQEIPGKHDSKKLPRTLVTELPDSYGGSK